MIIMARESLMRRWRKWRNSPDKLLQALIFIVVFGCCLYITGFLHHHSVDREALEIDYYDEALKNVRKRKVPAPKPFQPKLFKTMDRPIFLVGSSFEFLINVPNPDSWCKNKSNKTRRMLVIVSSPAAHLAHRQLIRNTWGSLSRIRDWKIKVIFMIEGQNDGSENFLMQQDEIENALKLPFTNGKSGMMSEAAQYNDIVIGHFANDKPKEYELAQHLMGYKWALRYCPNAEFILRTMDTTFVDMFQVMEKINHAVPRWILICEMGFVEDSRKQRMVEESEKATLLKSLRLNDYCKPHSMILSMDVVEKMYLLASGLGHSRTHGSPSNATLSYKPLSDSVPSLFKESVYVKLTGRDMQAALGIRVTNLAHKFIHSTDAAFAWANNGKFSRDQKPPWTFMVLPERIDTETRKNVRKLWTKIVVVNANVFQFQLLSRTYLGEKHERAIEKNMKSAVVKLKH